MHELSLHGKTVLITRARRAEDELVSKLESFGAKVLYFPTIEIVPPTSYDSLDRGINNLASYDWILFTSRNSVDFFLARFDELNVTRELINHCRILAVGSATAEMLKQTGINVTLIPEQFRAEGALMALKTYYSD